ncbi:Hypothetical predicted protein [Mytilus galloprovincialis]|uniref:Uncharacterized protein n=1 Tax=Mytilus galloprovincialis TaxID=29158 RepID=A0A8B6CDS6_MYTGA|nr:Hypothetical predicted protein [Mytilus galloprovincialis]
MLKKLKKQNMNSRKRLSERKLSILNSVIDVNFDEAIMLMKTERCLNFEDTSKTTVLMHACQAKADEKDIMRLVKHLLDKGAYIQVQNVFGKTALDYAKDNGLTQVETLLGKTIHCDFVEDLSWLL